MKDVVITGASSGIGAAIAREFAAHGWRTHLLARDAEKLARVQKTLQNKCEIYAVDLSQDEAITAAVQEIEKRGASVSVLVNNAGIYNPQPFDKEKADNWEWHFKTNLFAPVRLTRLLWPQLVKNRGAVTNVSSTLGLRPIANTGAYSASKAALDNWTQTLALEGGPLGVRANAISPGLVDTPIHGFHKSEKAPHAEQRKILQSLQPLGRLGEPEDIARAVYFVSSESAGWMTGTIVPVDGGVSVTTYDPFANR
jgi:NAD(P)-dependent dehydrogenase (short-subunit alcohol dehydrogenase family)